MISLNGIWQMKCTKDSQWQEAMVPGSVYTDLLRNGNMKDPFWGENEDEIKQLSEYDYEYTRTFSITDTVLECQQLLLVCEGLDTLAELSINGTLIAKTNNMHRTYRFDVKPYLHAGENTIHVLFYSPLQYVSKADAKKPLWGVTSTIPGYQHIRKAHSMFGWDWGPKLPDLGIFRNIYMEQVLEGRVKDFYVTQVHEDGKVMLTINVENTFPLAAASRFMHGTTEASAPASYFMHRTTEAPAPASYFMHRTAEAPASASVPFTEATQAFTETLTIRDPQQNIIYETNHIANTENQFHCTIENPHLWWPNGYGKQPLYEVIVTLSKDGQELHKCSKRIGLRTLTVSRKKDRFGESFGFEINGITIFAKGANYIPEDNLLGRTNPEKTRRLLQDCIAANFNCIRVWGGGNYPDSYFYDICDELGLIVWQDFMFACAVYDLTEEFTRNISAEFEDNIRRLRNHASLGMWCGNNEMESAWLYWGIPQNEKLRQDYLTMFERIIPEAVMKFDPETFYWPSSPSSGGGFDKTCDEGYGDAHYWDVWHGKKPFEDFENLYFRFASEYGFQSVPSLKTIRTFATGDDFNMFSNVMENHQKCIDNGHGNVTLMTYLHNYYQTPKDFETTVYTTQILQADCLETAISHFRSHRGRCLGSTYWQLNDCNPVVSWSTIDYYGRWKAAHYVVKRCYAPIIVNARKEDKEVTFFISSELQEAGEYTFFYKILHQQKGIIDSESFKLQMAPLSAQTVKTITLPDLSRADTRNCYIVYGLLQSGVEITSKTLLLVKPKQFAFENPDITAIWEETEDSYLLTLTAKVFARRVAIEFEHIDVVLSDNYFDLLPAESRTVTIAKNTVPDSLHLSTLKEELTIMSCYNITKN